MDFSFCRIAFTIILENIELKNDIADKNYLYSLHQTVIIMYFSFVYSKLYHTEQTLIFF